MGRLALLGTLLLVLVAAVVVLNLPESQPPLSPSPPTRPPNRPIVPIPQGVWLRGEMGIRVAATMVSGWTGRKILVDPEVEGTIAFDLPKQYMTDELVESFLAVVRQAGYQVTEGETIVIHGKPAPEHEAGSDATEDR